MCFSFEYKIFYKLGFKMEIIKHKSSYLYRLAPSLRPFFNYDFTLQCNRIGQGQQVEGERSVLATANTIVCATFSVDYLSNALSISMKHVSILITNTGS